MTMVIKSIECHSCKKRMGTSHRCYTGVSSEIHKYEDKIVCHQCWDKLLADAVGIAESQFLF